MKLCEEFCGVESQRDCKLVKFDQIQAPFAAFIFGDERLRAFQANSQFGLCEVRRATSFHQELSEMAVGFVRHAAFTSWTA